MKNMLDILLQLQHEDGSFPRKFHDDFTIVDNSGGSTPVSYTHLDVYKRQLMYVSLLLQNRKGWNLPYRYQKKISMPMLIRKHLRLSLIHI